MAIVRKSLAGLTTTLNAWKQSIQTWCNNTFAAKSHTHTQSQITNFSVHNGINLAAGIDYSSATTASAAATMPADGWIHVMVDRPSTGESRWRLYISNGYLTLVGNDWNHNSVLVPVKKGNKVYCNLYYNEGRARTTVDMWFYPLL